jgi:DNA topoisomerase-2
LTDPDPFIPKIKISKEEVKVIESWNLIHHLKAILEAKRNALFSKTDGKKKTNLTLKYGIDANFASEPRKAHLCTLFISEGKSASQYTSKWIDNMENGTDVCGILPVRGKFLNVLRANDEHILANKEIEELKKMLRLEEGMDYSNPENLKRLRYGRVVIMADADDDGKHIVALLLLYFHRFFPSLLHIGFVYNYLSPIIRVMKGRNSKKFLTFGEYEKWRKRNLKTYKTWTPRYFKGLGSSTDEEIKEDYNDPKIVKCIYDDYAPYTIRLAFSKQYKDQRKAWLAKFGLAAETELVADDQAISEYINTELVKFGMLSLTRAIPKLNDGFKESHRKVIWGALKVFKVKCGAKYRSMKVERFAGEAATYTNYHHGGISLQGAIKGMAQDFPGANNLPYFARIGQFGSRKEGGKDAAHGRYIETYPEKWLPYVFREEDLPLLNIKEDEGIQIEPETFYPILPMQLINGAQGIAIGSSTFIPPHNPLDIVNWLKCRINGKELPELVPWFRGFSGTVTVIDRRKEAKKKKTAKRTPLDIEKPANKVSLRIMDGAVVLNREEESDSEETPPIEDADNEEEDLIPDYAEELEDYVRKYREEKGQPSYALITEGKYHVDRKGEIVITELPIGRWSVPYYHWLQKLRELKMVKKIKNKSKTNSPGYVLVGFTPIPSLKSLRLRSQLPMSNMVLLDERNYPKRYDSVEEILEAFYVQRLEIYEKRKAYLIDQMEKNIPKLENKRAFIIAVAVDETLVIQNRPKKDVEADMNEMGFDKELLRTAVSKFTQDEIESLTKEIEDLRKSIEKLKDTPPESIYLLELQEFERVYRKEYNLNSKSNKIKLNKKK